jgi:tRNA nucleotidyltransferase/poly(A) polymerase
MKSLHETRLPLSREVREIIRALHDHGFSGYVVGGAVRDLLLGVTVSDWDLATDATPDRMIQIFPKVIPTGIRHGTVTVMYGTSQYELTTFRTDGDYAFQHALQPSAVTRSIEEDLRHRDFTINAMAYDSLTETLIDPFGGKRDLKKRIIRGVEDPVSRFHEDGLRPYRAIRFSVTLNCDIEKRTWKAIPLCLDRAKKAASERVRDEIFKILAAKNPSHGFEMMRRTGLLTLALPELLEGYGGSHDDPYHHALATVDAAPRHPPLRLACLLHEISVPGTNHTKEPHPGIDRPEIASARIAETVARRLRLSHDQMGYISHLIEHHRIPLDRRWTARDLRRFLSSIDRDLLDDLFALRLADSKASGASPSEMRRLRMLRQRSRQILRSGAPLSISQLAITGKTIQEILGIGEGAEIGRILDRLLDIVLADPTKNTPRDLARIVERMNRS